MKLKGIESPLYKRLVASIPTSRVHSGFFMDQDLNEQINNVSEFKCNDFSGIEIGHTFRDGNEYDETDNLIGPITTKVATTVDEYMAIERRME